MLGEGRDRGLAAGLAQVAQRGGGEVVVGVREGGPTGVGERVHPGRAAAAAVAAPGAGHARRAGRRPPARPDGGARRQARAPAARQGRPRSAGPARGSAGPRHRGCDRTVLEFHNTSMTYFAAAVTGGVARARVDRTGTGGRAVGCPLCCTAPSSCARPRAARRLPPGDHRAGVGARARAGDHRRQPRLLRRRVLHPARRPPAGRLLRQGRVLHHARRQGPASARSSSPPWATCRSSARHPLGRERHRRRRGRARRGSRARHLPGGHPPPGRPAVQVPHRGGPGGAAQRRAGGAGRRASARARCSRPGRGGGTVRRWASTSARRCTSGTAPARSAARGCCARSPKRSVPPCSSSVGQEYVDSYAGSARE